MNLIERLQQTFEPALRQLSPDPQKVGGYLGMIKPAQNAQHGDYQANCAMPLSKAVGGKAPEVAARLVEALRATPGAGKMLEPPQVAGPGFINLRLRDAWLAEQVRRVAADERLGIAPATPPKTLVIDYSGPNVAKPLHVGHLRSTIIGESLARLFRFLGHAVVADNHLGDWGTQFGILLHGYKHHLDAEAYAADPLRELARLYVLVRSQFAKPGDDDDAEPVADPVADACRRETAKLHAGDPENRRLWEQFMPHCLREIEQVYERLDIHFDTQRGESYFQPMLAGVVEDLTRKGIAVESNGAKVIPNAKGVVPRTAEELKKEEPPALIQKRDGAYTYTTTDLATIRHRVEAHRPDVMLYVVDFRQELHFRTVFANARRWGYEGVEMHHLKFGSVLGPDGKPLSTRKGGGVELNELLDEAILEGERTYLASRQEREELDRELLEFTPEEIQRIARTVGLGAVKYADLSQNRTSDYKFDFAKMLATDGNTATYMQYAYVRCRGIFRKAGVDADELRARNPEVLITRPEERALVLQLLRFSEALQMAAAEYMPHYLTGYLWDLAKAYSGFFQNCPVVKAEEERLRDSRLLLCDLTARIIQKTLHLLGIETIERM